MPEVEFQELTTGPEEITVKFVGHVKITGQK